MINTLSKDNVAELSPSWQRHQANSLGTGNGKVNEQHLLMLGKVLGGRYQVLLHLGGGGFGQTFLAQDRHLPGKPKCVVKQLKPQINDPSSLEAAVRLFDREAEVLYQLGSHPQIPQLFAHFEENAEFYLVQEFVEGTVLNKEMRRGRTFPEADVVELMQDILSTMAFVHEEQVIHRDIKPSNLIRRKSDDKIVLIDFGAVKQIGTHVTAAFENETTFTIAVGSSGYMPNEQLAGRPRYCSDVYAIGMVGIQMLSGVPPAQLRYDPRTGEILWRDRTEASDELADIIDRMVRYDYRHRFQSASETLEALQTVVAPKHDTVILPTVNSAIKSTTKSKPHPEPLPEEPESHDVLDVPSVVMSDAHLAWFERGDELFQQQRYERAVDCYERVIQAVPNNYLVWFKRGIALENLHRYEEAAIAYQRVIELQPEDYLAWFKRGKALEMLKHYEEALGAYDKVIQIQPDNYWAWHDRGKVLEESGRFEEAVSAYDRAVHLKPDFQLAVDSRKHLLSRLCQVDQLYHLQHYDEAIASCNRTLRDDPENSLAWLMRGMALENLKQYKSAATSYGQVVRIQPDDHLAWFKLGNLLERLHHYKEAASAYAKVTQIQPENQWAWHDRGRALEKMKQYEAAIAAYERALRINPEQQASLDGHKRTLSLIRKSGTRKKTRAKTTPD